MIPKRSVSEIVAADLQELIDAARPEGRMLDYKSHLPGGADEDKRNFLYDVSALANTAGGDIIYGMEEKRTEQKQTGLPERIVGVEHESIESTELRLDAIIRSGVDPRIPGIRFHWVKHPSAERPTLVLRIPKSLMAPHMVMFGGLRRFYGRGASGNYPLDVREIRAAFELGGDIARRLQAFRADRVIQIRTAGPTLKGSGRIVLHIVPLSALELGSQVDLTTPPQFDLLALDASPEHRRFNVDGYIRLHEALGYVQVFRSGALESVDSYMGSDDELPSGFFEKSLVARTEAYVAGLERLGTHGPFFVGLTLVGLSGRKLALNRRTGLEWIEAAPQFDRDLILLPEISIETEDRRPWHARLRPTLDAFWQAAGRSGSPNYDSEGKWRFESTDGRT